MHQRSLPVPTSPERRTKRGTALATVTALVAGSLAVAAGLTGASAASSNLLTNGDFEAGNLSGWTCSALDSVVTTPVHTGSYALAGAASAGDDAQCTQNVAVQPNTTYTLSGFVQGDYVYLGATGTGVNASTWTPANAGYGQLSTSFTTGATTTSVQVFTHGWYGEGTFYADDLTLTGPGGSGGGTSSPSASASASASPSSSASASASASPSSSPTSSPSSSASASPSASPTSTGGTGAPGGDGLVTAPTGITAKVTSNAVTLSWSASTDNSQTGDAPAYYVYNGANLVATSMGTSVTVSSLQPNTAYSFTVQGYDKDGHASAQSAPVSATTGALPTGAMKSAYFDQWSIYGNAYYPKNVDTSGAASGLKVMTYAFENIDPTNLTCFETVKASDSTNESDPNAGDGAGDAFADYQKSYTSDISVDGSSDAWSQPIKGNFNQLRELKAKYPNLRIVLSIGGWTYSKYFSDVAATDASRKKFVSSCIDMFIKGNLPTGVAGDASGGAGSAAGLFDGIDIDWEYPASANGHTGNHYSAADTANYTALLGEFRSELDAYGAQVGKHYLLTAALPSGQDKIALIQPAAISKYLDYGDIMTYDMHGAWESTGPTNFQDPLHDTPNDPSTPVAPGTEKYNIDETIKAYTTGDSAYGITGGFPASKLVLGVPFYFRGWSGVPAGSNYGLYQTATGASPVQTYTQQAGIADWKELAAQGLTTGSTVHWDPTTQSSWIYSNGDFYTGDTPQAIAARGAYATANGLGGIFAFSFEGDDSSGSLIHAMTGSMQ
ncbi:glycosyl hydrolase family 18 protein [Streptacidiphilus fuscans]|uniref:chitinase n=1 Tax=Streptacidiphilus fuscans TaxID=2789292 RepID=A0A931FJ52_9ACTN|nr:glycosyl hydrolase family 18 protein [Streptacidiphilus fuscans]MBF9072424.1 carbohydrate binding domain-containing protein [Streptacidiphilus fuscans]